MTKKCFKCGQHPYFSQAYDAFYCRDCDIWLEEKCSDPKCEFCFGRSEKPSQILQVKEHYVFSARFQIDEEKKEYFISNTNELYDILKKGGYGVERLIIEEKEKEMPNTLMVFTLYTTLEYLEAFEEEMEEIFEIVNEKEGIEVFGYSTKRVS